jgi:hypothetical protein
MSGGILQTQASQKLIKYIPHIKKGAPDEKKLA